MPNNYLSLLYKHIIQVENKNMWLKVGGTNIPLPRPPPPPPPPNQGRGMCYPVCWMVHIKEPLLLIGKSSPCGDSGFPLTI